MLEALLFDVDGTIAETEDLHRRAFNLAFAEHGLDVRWDADEYRRLLAVPGGKERIAHSLAERRQPRTVDVTAIHRTKTRRYRELLAAEGVRWRPGVARLMDEAREKGLRLALVTTTTEANLDPLFTPVLGPWWRGRFDAVVAGDAVARKKPAPDLYVEALGRLGVHGAEAVAFEDSRAGVTAARGADLAVVATPSQWLPGDDLSGADLVLEHLGDAQAPWTRPHAILGSRWATVRSLEAWHAEHVKP